MKQEFRHLPSVSDIQPSCFVFQQGQFPPFKIKIINAQLFFVRVSFKQFSFYLIYKANERGLESLSSIEAINRFIHVRFKEDPLYITG